MKRISLLLLSVLFSISICKGQSYKDSSIIFSGHILSTGSPFEAKDSCWWDKRIDTIKTDFIITVDENNFVKKYKTDFVIHEYETKNCKFTQMSFYSGGKRNEIYVVNGEQVQVLLYRPKDKYGALVGNIQ